MLVDIREFKSFPIIKKRFLAKFPKNYKEESMIDSCWNWEGAKSNKYGEIWYGSERYRAHRMSYIVFKNPIRSDQLVRHTCDNPLCVNPKHLILGNQQANMRDCVERTRQGSQKLNEEAVKVIKWMLKYKPKRGLATKLASLHNVTIGTISNIKTERIWPWVKV